MAFVQYHCHSHALGMAISFWAVLPQKSWQSGAKLRKPEWPVLYLLHGLSDDHTIWTRRTSIERYVEKAGIAAVMPCVHKSFYADMKWGDKYWTFISEEFPYLVRQFVPVTDKRSKTYVAGLSMGGYGAFKMALSMPDKFSAACSLSGALEAGHIPLDERCETMLFGGRGKGKGTVNDLFALATRLGRKKGPKPRLYQWCGTEDFLLQSNRSFAIHAVKQGVRLVYRESPGDHEWRCWDEQIKGAIDWFVTGRLD